MNNLDIIFREEFTLTILDYLSGEELIDPVFVLCNIAKSQINSLNDPKLIEVITEIYFLDKQLADGNKEDLSTEHIKEKLKEMINKLENK